MSGSNGIEPMVVDEEQAARMLGISRRMVFEFRSKGELQHVKFGRLIRYPGPESLWWTANAFGNAVAKVGRHRLGNEPDEYPGTEGRASRRSRDSQLPDLS